MGERFPKLSGNGTLVKSGDLSDITNAKAEEAPLDVKMMGAGLVLACCFFCAAKVLALWIPIPAPILMIILAALIKVLNIMPTVMEQGAKQWYKFVSGNLTWALLVGVGVIYTPWNDVLAAITPAYIFTIMATIFGMVVSGAPLRSVHEHVPDRIRDRHLLPLGLWAARATSPSSRQPTAWV